MLKRVNLNLYANGYSVRTGGSCIDLPLAVVAGNINAWNYEAFLAYRVACKNWNCTEEDFVQDNVELCSHLGLKFQSFEATAWENLLLFVRNQIDNETPIFLPATYDTLFYYLAFNDKVSHMLMITGYDEEKSLILITDCNMVRHDLELQNTEYTLYEMAVTEDILRSIWDKSNLFFENHVGFFYQKLFTITSNPTRSAKDFKYFIQLIYNNISPNCNILLNELCNLIRSRIREKEDINNYFIGLRRNHLWQFTVLFDFLEGSVSVENKTLLNTIRTEFFNDRATMLSRLQINILKNKSETFLLQDLSDKIKHGECKLIHFMKQIAENS